MRLLLASLFFVSLVYCYQYVEPFDEQFYLRWNTSASEAAWTSNLEAWDINLQASVPNKLHIATSLFPGFSINPKEAPIVLQFDAHVNITSATEQPSNARAYVKLIRDDSNKYIDEDSGYMILFGLNLATKKIDLTIAVHDPERDRYQLSQYNKCPEFPQDNNIHLYTLIVKFDSTFLIYLDGRVFANGTLEEGWNPPIFQPTGVPDPEDIPPVGWNGPYEEEELANIPTFVLDPAAVKPEDWDESAPLQIPNPAYAQPEEWDEELDGEWVPPLMDNPYCLEHGCGPWEPPLVRNPKLWQPIMRPNPDYFHNNVPFFFKPLKGISTEVLFDGVGKVELDNIYVGHNATYALKTLKPSTFDVKQKIISKLTGQFTEKNPRQKAPKQPKGQSTPIQQFLADNALLIFSGVVGAISIVLWASHSSKSSKQLEAILADEDNKGEKKNQNQANKKAEQKDKQKQADEPKKNDASNKKGDAPSKPNESKTPAKKAKSGNKK